MKRVGHRSLQGSPVNRSVYESGVHHLNIMKDSFALDSTGTGKVMHHCFKTTICIIADSIPFIHNVLPFANTTSLMLAEKEIYRVSDQSEDSVFSKFSHFL